MADQGPNLKIGYARLKIRQVETKLNIDRAQLRLLELADEIAKVEENIVATEKVLSEINQQLAAHPAAEE